MNRKTTMDEYSDAFKGTPPEADQTVADESPDVADSEVSLTETPAISEDTEAVMAQDVPAPEAAPEGEAPAGDAPAAEAPAAEEMPPAEEGGEQAEMPLDDDAADVPPEDMQAYKSWRGRLKKREEELAAREAALAEQPAGTESPAEEAAAPLSAEESDARIQALRDDFGDDFVDAIMAIVENVVSKKSRELHGEGRFEDIKGEIDALVGDLQNTFSAMHRDAITSEVPDIDEITSTEEFQKFCVEHKDPERCRQIVEGGTARQIIALMKEYREYIDQADESPVDDAALAVAGAAPLQLPRNAPASPDDEYRSAWKNLNG